MDDEKINSEAKKESIDGQDGQPSEPDVAANASQSVTDSCSSCVEYLAGWKRAQADYQNLKKDYERERVEFVKYAQEALLHDFLPVMDQFALALAFVPDTSMLLDEQRKSWENWLIGVRAVQSQWEKLAYSVGMQRISTDVKFDPVLHEAAGQETVEGKESGAIVKVVQEGWRLHDKILRPARVILAT